MSDDKLLNHYTALLNSLAVYVDENGALYTKKKSDSDTRVPVTLLNKRMVLPTHAILSNPNWDAQVAFHPLSESILRGESEVLQWIKERVVGRLRALVCVTMTHLTHLAANGELQKNLSTQQLSTINELGDADEKTVKLVEDLVKNILQNNEELLHIYLRHSGKKGNNTYRRFAKVSFPLYEKLVAGTQIPSLKNARVKDTKFLIKVLEEIYPEIAKEDHYSYGSISDTAPYYHSLIHAFANVGKPVSATIYNFRKVMSDIVDSRVMTEDWIDDWNGVCKSASFYPQLQHNIGLAGDGNEETVPVAKTVKEVVNDVPETTKVVNQVIEAGTNGFKPIVFDTVAPQQVPVANPFQQNTYTTQNVNPFTQQQQFTNNNSIFGNMGNNNGVIGNAFNSFNQPAMNAFNNVNPFHAI